MDPFENRKFILLAIFLLTGLVFIFRLFYIQVVDDSYKISAKNQALRYVTQYPVRGLIYDRNKTLLVYNEAAYDLMVIPRQVINLDTLSFCELIGIDIAVFRQKMEKANKYSGFKASVFEKQFSADAFSRISEKLYKYPGFFSQKRTLRRYPDGIAAHVLGYISEVDNRIIERDAYYKSGDYIGASGLEQTYEYELRGERGLKILMVDVHNRVKGSYMDGKYDTLAISGKELITTLDAKLQSYGEKLMQNKKGSVVAIEPATGEILSLISAPSYDPNLLVGRERAGNYIALLRNDSLKPLFNRATMAPYPPGSIYKMVQALIGLQEEVINTTTGFPCNRSQVNCHNHPPASNLKRAVQYSCNPYFYSSFKRIINQNKSSSIFKDSEIGLEIWKKHMLTFGFGQQLGIDLPGEKSGSVPGVALYDKMYGAGRWAFSTIYSISIGQGEVQVIPLQMANLAALIANKGYYYTPHLIKSIGEQGDIRAEYKEKHLTSVEQNHYELIMDAMQAVVESPGGTARRAKIPGITVCGKTGTAENPHGEDHSVFIAFAPKEQPKIAIAVYVENAGFGGTWAAPVARLMIEQYLRDSISDPLMEATIMEAVILDSKKKEETE